MSKKNYEKWSLDLKQVQRLKAGVQKYINDFQLGKSRDKSSISQSPKLSSSRKSSIQLDKNSDIFKKSLDGHPHGSKKKSQQQMYQPKSARKIPKKSTKQKEEPKIPIFNKSKVMPKGFTTNEQGKIVKNDIVNEQEQKNNLFSQLIRKQKNKNLDLVLSTLHNKKHTLYQKSEPDKAKQQIKINIYNEKNIPVKQQQQKDQIVDPDLLQYQNIATNIPTDEPTQNNQNNSKIEENKQIVQLNFKQHYCNQQQERSSANTKIQCAQQEINVRPAGGPQTVKKQELKQEVKQQLKQDVKAEQVTKKFDFLQLRRLFSGKTTANSQTLAVNKAKLQQAKATPQLKLKQDKLPKQGQKQKQGQNQKQGQKQKQVQNLMQSSISDLKQIQKGAQGLDKKKNEIIELSKWKQGENQQIKEEQVKQSEQINKRNIQIQQSREREKLANQLKQNIRKRQSLQSYQQNLQQNVSDYGGSYKRPRGTNLKRVQNQNKFSTFRTEYSTQINTNKSQCNFSSIHSNISFTQKQQFLLKSKYNNLNSRLDALRDKIKQQCSQRQKLHPKIENNAKNTYLLQRAEITRLYNKHSPLKKYYHLIEQRERSKHKNQYKTQVKFEDMLRGGSQRQASKSTSASKKMNSRQKKIGQDSFVNRYNTQRRANN